MNDLHVEPLSPLNPPVAKLLEGVQADWLVRAINERFNRGDYNLAVGAGLLARYASWSKPAREVVEGLFAGHVDEAVARPRRWARALSDNEARTLELLARAEVMRLSVALDELEAALAPEDELWQTDFHALCQGRDALEGIRVLATERNVNAALNEELAYLDERGTLFVRSLSVVVKFDDEWLREAKRLEPDCWWTSSASR